MKSSIIIPARLESSRLHQKMLQTIGGIPLIAHTAARCLDSNAHKVFVATDSPLIVDAVKHLNVTPVLTPENLATGSDRVAFVANTVATEFDVVINVQGDEPFLDPKIINMLLDDFQTQFDAKTVTHKVNTACTPLLPDNNNHHHDIAKASVVKVVTDLNGYALYFSRHGIPFVRNPETAAAPLHRKHLGIYGFQRDFLVEFTSMARTPLETAESLEQLRLLEHGHRIRVLEIGENMGTSALAIDTAADLEAAEIVWQQRKG